MMGKRWGISATLPAILRHFQLRPPRLAPYFFNNLHHTLSLGGYPITF